MRRGLILVAALMALIAAGCGSVGDAPGDPTATATVAPFDAQLLTGVVLNPNDVPGLESASGTYSPRNGALISFGSVMVRAGVRIQTTVVHYGTPAEAEADFARNRQVLPGFGAREENYSIPNADSAFLYRVFTPPGLASFAVRDNYTAFIQTAPIDAQNPAAAAVDEAEFARIAGIVFSRLNTLIETPQLITPIAGGQNEPTSEPGESGTAAPAATAIATP